MTKVNLPISGLIIFILFTCNCKNGQQSIKNNQNIKIDSLFSLYIPLTILDSNANREGIFDNQGYVMMWHNGYLYASTSNPDCNVKIVYEAGNTSINHYSDTLIGRMIDKELFDIKMNQSKNTYIDSDTFNVIGQKAGVIRRVIGCGEQALYVTSCHILAPSRSKLYHVIITCDNSEVGFKLRDSIPTIVNSFNFLQNELN